MLLDSKYKVNGSHGNFLITQFMVTSPTPNTLVLGLEFVNPKYLEAWLAEFRCS